MKKTFSLFATFALLLLASCTKEKSIDSLDPDAPQAPGTGGTTGLLTKTVMKYGTDSITIAYQYDNENRMTRQTLTATEADFINVDMEVKRASSGQIRQTIMRSDEFVAIGLDSVVYNVFYDAAKKQYTHRILEFSVPGGTYKDSTAYTYGADNNIVKKEVFIFSPFISNYFPASKVEYVYSAGSLAKELTYEYDEIADEYNLISDNSYEYDAKVNPLVLGQEAIVLDQTNLQSRHNILLQTTLFPDEPADNINATASYTYNSSNKPVQSTIIEATTGETYTQTYYYQ